MKKWIFAVALGLSQAALANGTLNVLCWDGYISDKVIHQFEKKTGIHVNFETVNDNPELYTKLKLTPGTYDVVSPSSYYVKRLSQDGLLEPLDKSKLPNAKYLNPKLLDFEYDPENTYSLPFFWGTLGIVVNSKFYNPKSMSRWDDLWQSRFRGKLLALNEAREIFDIALSSMGYSINTDNSTRLHLAYLKLLKLNPNIKLFNEEQEASIYADEDAVVGTALNGDAYRAWLDNKHIHFIYPQGDLLVWIDTLAIPKGAPSRENAYKFINFLMQPQIAKELAASAGYSSPNLAGIKLLPKNIRNNPILYPPKARMKHAQVESYLNDHAKSLMLKYWDMLKLN